MPGKVVRVVTGFIQTEVVMKVVGGFEVVAIVTNDSATTVELATGSTAIPIFKASSVVIGVYVTPR